MAPRGQKQDLKGFVIICRHKYCFLIMTIAMVTIIACHSNRTAALESFDSEASSENIRKPDEVILLPARTYGSASIEFSSFPMAQSPWVDQILTDEIGLELSGIHGINEKAVLIYGGFAVGGFFRSLVLRSDDGGKSFREVMVPEELSYTSEIFFSAGGIGWAVVKRCPEGIESANLYQTQNSGSDWHKAGALPNHGQGSYDTLGLRFSDVNHGEIWAENLRIDEKGTEHIEFCLCRTTDGGQTWQWTDMCCQEDDFDFNWIKPDISTASNGTQWRKTLSKGDGDPQWIGLQRRRPGEIKWETVALIPRKFKYDNGHLKAKIRHALPE
jgi:hypothetical protein